jgi:hypothetical protein
MTMHSARLGALLAVATFLGCPSVGPRAGEGTSGGEAMPLGESAEYRSFDRANATNIGIIATLDTAGSCLPFITPTMEVELVRNDNKSGGTAWLVQNQCNKDLVVSVSDFKLNGSLVPEAPVKCKSFPSGSGDLSAKVAPGEIGVITCRAKPGDDGDYKYKYSVKYDTVVIDPDIIIKRR